MANAEPNKRKALLTPPFRVSFPSVFEKASFNNGTPRYSLTGLFYPKKFTDADKQKWAAIRKQLDVVSVEGFKKNLKDLNPGDIFAQSPFKRPFHRGNEKDYQGYGDPDMIYISMANSKRRPQILDKSGTPITAENAEEFYAGCWARASVNPYWFNNIGKGIAIGLCNLQKLGDDESFEGFTSADDDFGGEASEFDAGSDDDEFGVGGGNTNGEAEDDPTA